MTSLFERVTGGPRKSQDEDYYREYIDKRLVRLRTKLERLELTWAAKGGDERTKKQIVSTKNAIRRWVKILEEGA